MADVSKIKLPDSSEYNIKDYRIPGVDTTPTSGSDNVVTSGGVYDAIIENELATSSALNDLNERIDNVDEIVGDGSDFVKVPDYEDDQEVVARAINDLNDRIDEKYTKPSTGIPASDLADNVVPYIENFYFVEGSSSQAGNSTSGSYLSTKWEGQIQGGAITQVYNGLKIAYRIKTNTGVSTAGVVLSIDGTNYYPVVIQKNTLVTTHYPVGSTPLMVFNSTQTASAYLTSNTKTTVTGCWQIMEYDSNTNAYQREYVSSGDVEYPITTRYNTTSGESYYAEYGRYSEGVTLNPSTNTITASGFKITNGTSSQFLKADGSVDSNTYATTSQIPSAVTESTVSGWGFTKNAGTVTGVKMNGTTNNPTSGVVDLGNIVTSETDPVFSGSVAAGITSADISKWNSAGNAKIFYGTCNSQSAYTNKTVVCSDFTSADLVKGALIFITFDYTNSADVEDVRLNVNGTGNLSVKEPLAELGSIEDLRFNSILQANCTYLFTYDGTYWVLLTGDSDKDTKYSIISQSEAQTGTSTTGRSVSAASLKRDIEYRMAQNQADWNVTNTSSAAYIKNKPTIPSVPVTDVTVGGTSVLSNGTAVIPAIPDGLPSVSSSDNGKILTVVSGDWAASTASSGGITDVTVGGTSVVSGGTAVIPAIPSAPGTLNTTATTAQSTSASEVLSGSITLHKVAKTGTYSDLIGTPTIPTVPTNVSSFTNDANYVKYVLCANEAAYNAISNKDSGTLYLIPVI